MDKRALLRLINEAVNDRREQLDLSGKGITELPPEIGRLEHVRILDLGDNNLRALPLQFANLSKLWGLCLDGNLLSVLPPEICDLGQLSHISLSNNRLTTLPREFSNLKQLQFLYLGGETVRWGIDSDRNLSPISNEGLTSLPPVIGTLESLIHLFFCKGSNY